MNFGSTLGIGDSANNWDTVFATVEEALNALSQGREGEEAFDRIQKFESTPEQDDLAYAGMLDSASDGYDWLTNNCWGVIEDGLDAASIDRVIGSWYPNQAFNLNESVATTLNFNDVLNGLAE